MATYLDKLKKMWAESAHLTNPPITEKEVGENKTIKVKVPAIPSTYTRTFTMPDKVAGMDLDAIVAAKYFFDSIGCELTATAIMNLRDEVLP